MTTTIIKPEKKYLLSYLEACKETWNQVHDNYILHDPDKFQQWKDTIFIEYENNFKGINLPDAFLPSQTYWIVDNDIFIGTINMRFRLNDNLKKYGGHAGYFIRLSRRNSGYGKIAISFILNKIKDIAEDELLLTCEEDNNASINLIEQFNPSRIETDVCFLHDELTKIRRYYFS